jgi:heat shock protein HtpX
LALSLVVLILAPVAALLLKAAISRRREALADATAVDFTRNPTGLRSALEVLARDSTVVQQRSNAIAHIWIESPLDGKAVSKLFATHPPIEERIATLRAMEGK